jgi:outer membrane protein assembly factor BamB
MPRSWLPRAFLSFLLAVLGAGLLAGAAPAPETKPAANWPQWRGPSGQGYSDDAKVPLTWSDKENFLWKTKLPGAGNSTPIVWGDRIFLTASSPKGAERYVLCVRTTDGTVLWEKTAAKDVPVEKTHDWNGHASASCATDGTYVFAFFGTPGLFCYDFDGNLVWKHQFGIFTSETGWGTAASPFLYEDLVIQNCDNDGAKGLPPGAKKEDAAPMALVALDKKTGEVKWTTPRDQGRGFSTPRLIVMEKGRVDLVLNGPLGVWGYDPKTGKELWHCDRTAPGDQARFGEPMPVSDGETLFVSSGRPGPCQALRLPGEGDVTKTHVRWQAVRKGHRDVSSPILWEGRVYAADSGLATLSCYDLKTGEELYTGRLGNGNKSLASPVSVRGKLLYLLDDGETVVLEPGPKMKVVGRNRLGEGGKLEFGASPAIADGRLFLRSQTQLYCIGEKKD